MMIINISNSPSVYQVFLGASSCPEVGLFLLSFVPSSALKFRILLRNSSLPWKTNFALSETALVCTGTLEF